MSLPATSHLGRLCFPGSPKILSNLMTFFPCHLSKKGKYLPVRSAHNSHVMCSKNHSKIHTKIPYVMCQKTSAKSAAKSRVICAYYTSLQMVHTHAPLPRDFFGRCTAGHGSKRSKCQWFAGEQKKPKRRHFGSTCYDHQESQKLQHVVGPGRSIGSPGVQPVEQDHHGSGTPSSRVLLTMRLVLPCLKPVK